ncbi:PEP-CTERM sorting domain-containing protein [Paucibacter sp. R3-3]|uniref:PEP-CTERM sorting domain-containing protein n=1 Tax=Roseateles agri TaxID=3098619 RepID=A0ABU5D9U2_9BURK|nr:PEP-CTERM sorting domain-containing protein [Paucibacter sp. R3-3]MDY0742914.1 PEP-CTERM sorting domain-containing protein [Paucibacter sp. R3-3]
MKLSYVLAGIAGAVLSCNALAITPGGSTLVDFSDGADGWIGRVGPPVAGGTTWDTSLGNDAPSLHTVYNDFLKVGLRYYTDGSAFTGDYTKAQSVTIGLDVDPIRMAVPTVNGDSSVAKDIYVDLIDYDHPADGYDSSFVSFKLGTLTEGTDWQHLSVTLTSTGSASLPAGWTAVDSSGNSTMAAGLTFAQLLSGVDEIAFRIPGTKQGSAMAYDVAVDNISISSVAAAVPEPASAALMLAGLMGVGLGARRSRGAKR